MAFELGNQVTDFTDGDGVNPGQRLIKQQESRPCGEGAGNFHPAAFTTRKGQGAGVAEVADIEFHQQFFQHDIADFGITFNGFQNGADILFNRQATENAGLLWQVADPQLGAAEYRQVGDIGLINHHAAFIIPDQPRDHVKAGCLAGAIRAKQANSLTPADIKGDVTDNAFFIE